MEKAARKMQGKELESAADGSGQGGRDPDVEQAPDVDGSDWNSGAPDNERGDPDLDQDPDVDRGDRRDGPPENEGRDPDFEQEPDVD